MKRKKSGFPITVTEGSVSVKIYKIRNKFYTVRLKNGKVKQVPRFSFKVSYFAEGRRFQKLFADLDEAKAHAQKKAEDIDQGNLKALPFGPEQVRIYTTASHYAKQAGIPLDLLAKDAARYYPLLHGKMSPYEVIVDYLRQNPLSLPKKSLPDAVDDMIKDRLKETPGSAYLKVLKVYLLPLKEAFKCPLRSVTSAQIGEYIRNLEVSPRSKNNTRATIGAFFKYCKQKGWLSRDHDGIELVPKFKVQATDITIFTPAEVTKFLTHATEEMIPFLAIGAFAGLRSAEIERLDWREVNLANRFIEVKAAKAKTAARRIVPVSVNLAAWLKGRTKDSGPVVPFKNLNKRIGWLEEDVDLALALDALKKAAAKAGKSDWTEQVLKDAHLKWLKAARTADAEKKRAKGAKDKSKKVELPQARPGHTFLPDQTPVKYAPCPWKKNALRHSYISYRVADVQDVPKVALESGNSPQMIFQHYRELVQVKAAKDWFSIKPEKLKTES